MRRAIAPAIAISLAAALPAAGDITLAPPIDCDLGADCYIQQYFDHDASRGAHDYLCAPLSYDDHAGTDFALRTLDQMLEAHEHIALLVGEYGGTAGIVTMEDLVETLLGLEILDESDADVDMQALARGQWQKRAKRLGLVTESEVEDETTG